MSSDNDSGTNTDTGSEKSFNFDDESSSDFGVDSDDTSDYSDPDDKNNNLLNLKKESVAGKINKAKFFLGTNLFILLTILVVILLFYFSGWLSFDNGFNSSIN
jgi:hypothetical protein